MVKRKFKIILILIPVIIIGVGIGSFYIIGYLNYAEIQELYSFYYKPTVGAEPEELTIQSRLAEINVNYNTSSVSFHIKADVNLEIKGIYLKGANLLDYFFMEWVNLTSGTMTRLYVDSNGATLGLFYHPSWTVQREIIVNITLRTDILYDVYVVD